MILITPKCGVPDIMNVGCSDDGFEYFRNWMISRGKEVYYAAKENPDSLISEYVEGKEYYDLEDFWYVALTAFKNKTDKELNDRTLFTCQSKCHTLQVSHTL